MKPLGPGERPAVAYIVGHIAALLAVVSLVVWAVVQFGAAGDWVVPGLLGLAATATIIGIAAIESRHYFVDPIPSSRRRWRTAWPRMTTIAALALLFLGPCFFPITGSDDLLWTAIIWAFPVALYWWLVIHPHVDIHERELVIANPLGKVHVPLDSIESMEPGWSGLVIRSSRGVTRARAFWEGVGIASTPPWRSEEFIVTASDVAGRNLRRPHPGETSTYSEDYRPWYRKPSM